MKLSDDQLPRRFEFTTVEDIAQVALSPVQRCCVETRKADAISALVSLQVDTNNVNKFVQAQAYWTGISDFCSELLAIQSV